MSLLSIDITKARKLSLGLPAPGGRLGPTNPLQLESPPTEEEITYSTFVAINPLIEELVERLDLVSTKTTERIKKVGVINTINKLT